MSAISKGRSQASRSRDPSLGPHPARGPNTAGSRLRRSSPPATLQSFLQTLRQVLSLHPRTTLQTRPALSPALRDPDALASSWTPGPRMGCSLHSRSPQVSSQRARQAAPSLLRRRMSGSAPGPRRGAAGGAGGGRGEGGCGRWGTRRGSSHCWEDSRAKNEEETLLLIPSNDSANEKPWTLFAIALPTSFSSLLPRGDLHVAFHGCRPRIAILCCFE